MITTTDLSNWLGASLTAAISGTQLAAALSDGTRYCNGKMQEMGMSGSGDAYDAAVFYVARVSIIRQLDAMGIKPSSLNMGGTLTISSDVSAACDQLLKMADERLQSAILFGASNQTSLYIVRLRGGQGANR